MWQGRHGKQCYKDNMHIQGDLMKVDIQSCFQAKTGSVRTLHDMCCNLECSLCDVSCFAKQTDMHSKPYCKSCVVA